MIVHACVVRGVVVTIAIVVSICLLFVTSRRLHFGGAQPPQYQKWGAAPPCPPLPPPVCSNIAAHLYTLDTSTQVRKSLSCTSVPCYWLPPTFRSVVLARICDINFSTPQKKRKKLLDQQTHPPTNAITTRSPFNLPIPTTNVKASSSEPECFYKTLSEAGKSVNLQHRRHQYGWFSFNRTIFEVQPHPQIQIELNLVIVIKIAPD